MMAVATVLTFRSGRARSKQAKDAGSARMLCDAGATEDAGMRRSAAGQDDNCERGRDR